MHKDWCDACDNCIYSKNLYWLIFNLGFDIGSINKVLDTQSDINLHASKNEDQSFISSVSTPITSEQIITKPNVLVRPLPTASTSPI